MIEPMFLIGWSVGGFSMIAFNMMYDSWTDYKKILRESKCNCQTKLSDWRQEE